MEAAKKKGEPFVVLFLGINGTGKTTTVAKFAYFLKQSGFSVAVAAGDTHRAGAIEQLTEHADRMSVRVIAQRYGADPAAVARDGVLYAKSHHVDVLIVDTAGRMQTNQNLMEEMGKIVQGRQSQPEDLYRRFAGRQRRNLAGPDVQEVHRLRRGHPDQD